MATAQEYLDAGNEFFEEEKFEDAITCYSEVINLAPKFWGAYFNRGICYSKLKEYEKAIKDFSNVVNIDKTHKDAYIERALCYANISKYDEVILDYTELIKLDPYNTEFYSARAHILERCNQYDAVAIAVKDYTKIIALDPTNTDAFNSRANCYKKMGEYQKAINDYTKSIELDPDNAYYYKDRTDCYIKLGKYDKAMINLEECFNKKDINRLDMIYEDIFHRLVYIDKFDDATILQLNYISSYEEIYYKNRAYTCVKMKKYDIAIDYFNKALEFAGGLFGGSVGEIYCDIAKCHNILENQTDANRAWENAIKHYTTVIEYNENYLTIQCNNYFKRANCYKAIGEDDKALKDLAKINEIREEDIDEDNIDYKYYFDKANYFEQKNETDKAKEYYMKTIKKCQEDDDYYSYTGNRNIVAFCYEKLGEKNKAIEAYYKTIEDFTSEIEKAAHPDINYAIRASFYEGIGDYKKAIEDYTNAIECDFSGYYYKYRANCYEEIKDYEKAIEDYKKALVFEYESLSDILEIQEKLGKLSKITSTPIKIFENTKFIMQAIQQPFDNYDDSEDFSDDYEKEENNIISEIPESSKHKNISALHSNPKKGRKLDL